MDAKQLVEYKKFMPPPVIWTVLILVVGWALKEYAPPEYANYATLAWGVILTIAAGYGVSKQKLYELAGTTGIELPAAAPAPEGTQYDLPAVVKPATNQRRLARTLL